MRTQTIGAHFGYVMSLGHVIFPRDYLPWFALMFWTVAAERNVRHECPIRSNFQVSVHPHVFFTGAVGIVEFDLCE